MARCGGSTGTCTCAVQGTNGIKVTGNGSASVPYIVELDLSTAGSTACLQVMDCVGNHTGDGLTYTEDDALLSVDISSDTGNLLEFGDDGGLYGPVTSLDAGTAVTITGNGTPESPYVINAAPEIGDTALQAGDGIKVTGAGIASDPYVISTSPSYAVAGIPSAVVIPDATTRLLVPLTLGGTTSVTEGGDVTRNSDGTLTINRPGFWQVSLMVRLSAAATAAATAYAFIYQDGVSRAWGGLTVPITQTGATAYTLGYTLTASVNATAPAVISVQAQRSYYTTKASVTLADVSLVRVGDPLSQGVTLPSSPPPPDTITDF